MRPGFQLNCHDRKRNPAFESHDPSMMWDPVSGMYYSYSTDAAITSDKVIGIPIRRSKDLVHFCYLGHALSEDAIREAAYTGMDREPTEGFWAPYTEYVVVEDKKTGLQKGEYRMYYSATRGFGSSESRIWLAVSDSPEGPFENRGVVVSSWHDLYPSEETVDWPNAIDPHIIRTGESQIDKQQTYLVYGSFFGGIYLKRLNNETGLSDDSMSHGICISKKPADSNIDGPEGASIMYHKESGYYYLFQSYGWLGDNYDVRVGRSRQVTGPYVDADGKNLMGASCGLKILGSYCFHASKPYAAKWNQYERPTIITQDWKFHGFRGPGHGVPFLDIPNNEYFFVHHVRDGAENLCVQPEDETAQTTYLMHYLVVRRMVFLRDWPVIVPEPFTREEKPCQVAKRINVKNGVPEKLPSKVVSVNKTWEWILFDNNNNDIAFSHTEDFNINEINVVYGKCYDFENSRIGLVLTGLTSDYRVIWGKAPM